MCIRDRGTVGNPLDLAVVRISNAREEVDETAGNVLVGRLEVEYHGTLCVQMIGNGAGIVKPLGLDPVSYTHLDVYKRQGQAPLAMVKQRINQRSLTIAGRRVHYHSLGLIDH